MSNTDGLAVYPSLSFSNMGQLSNQIMIQRMLLTRTIMIIGPTNVQIAAEVGSGLIQQLNGERIQVWNEPDVTLPAELTPI